MNFPFFIAKRYVLAKKSRNAINVITAISIGGITIGTMAFIIILSVFNGFDMVVRDLFNSFYADLEIRPVEGKTFSPLDEKVKEIRKIQGVKDVASMLEDNALLIFDNRQTIGTVRGISDNYAGITGIDTIMYGKEKFALFDKGTPLAVVGRGMAYYLGIDPDFLALLQMIVPKRTSKISMDPNRALNSRYIKPGSIFASQPDLDAKYVLVPLRFSQELFDYNNEISAYEVGLDEDVNSNHIQEKIQQILGNKFSIHISSREHICCPQTVSCLKH